MCFGNSKSSTSQTTQDIPSWLTSAAQQNIGAAENLQNKGFTPYTGQQVASFSPQQQQSFGLAGDVANSASSGPINQLTTDYATAPAHSVSADPIYSRMSPYMNQYVGMALAPQLALQDQQFAGQNKSFDSSATGAGAFGDTGWGLGRSNLTQQQNLGRSGLIGNAYNAAFNTAIGAGAQDVANSVNAQTTNANLGEAALGRELTGANALQSQQTGATNLLNSTGGQQTAQSQAGLNAAYNQWLMAQQYPFQTIQAMNSAITSGRQGAPIGSTTTTSAPDNSGWGMIGAALPLIAAPFTGGLSLAAEPAMAGAAMGQGGIGHAADGGAIPAGQPTLVGERGPEVIVPGADSVVIPNEVLEAAREKRAKKVGQPQMQFGIAA